MIHSLSHISSAEVVCASTDGTGYARAEVSFSRGEEGGASSAARFVFTHLCEMEFFFFFPSLLSVWAGECDVFETWHSVTVPKIRFSVLFQESGACGGFV